MHSTTIFKYKQTQLVIEYIREKYGDELEFLWESSPKNAIWRNKNNRKWYGVLLTVEKSKLGLDAEGAIEVLNLMLQPEMVMEIIDCKRFFNAYHMNKKHWISINLDSSVDIETIYRMIDNSYKLSENRRK